jgi:hypothetical protein
MSNHNDPQSNQPAQPVYDRIGASNLKLLESFNDGVVISVPRSQGNTLASANTQLTRAFNGTKVVVVDDPLGVETSSSTTIASHNVDIEDVFENAVIAATSTQLPVVIASGNKDVKSSFNGIQIGVGVSVGQWVATGIAKQGGGMGDLRLSRS